MSDMTLTVDSLLKFLQETPGYFYIFVIIQTP